MRAWDIYAELRCNTHRFTKAISDQPCSVPARVDRLIKECFGSAKAAIDELFRKGSDESAAEKST